MNAREAAVGYSTLQDLVDGSEITAVNIYDVEASRIEASGDTGFDLQVRIGFDEAELEVRCKLTARGMGGKYAVDGGAVYTLEQKQPIEEHIQRQFAESVGLMALYPYLRATLSQLAGTLNLPRPVLPLLRQGMVSLTKDSADESTGEAVE